MADCSSILHGFFFSTSVLLLYIFLSASFSRGKDKEADLLSSAFEGSLLPGMLK